MARVINSFNLMFKFSGVVTRLTTIKNTKIKLDIEKVSETRDIKVVLEDANSKNKFTDTIQTIHDMRFLTTEDINDGDIIEYENISYKIVQKIRVQRDNFNIYLGVKSDRL